MAIIRPLHHHDDDDDECTHQFFFHFVAKKQKKAVKIIETKKTKFVSIVQPLATTAKHLMVNK